MSETEAAAERVRRIRNGENFAAVYGIENQVRERATFVDPRVLELHHADEQTVIAEYLALVRPDDAMPVTAEWLRSITSLPVCKNGSGGYSDTEVTLFLNDWESQNKDLCRDRFWVLTFGSDKDGWRTRVSAQDGNRHAGTLHMAKVKTRGDVRSLLARVLGTCNE